MQTYGLYLISLITSSTNNCGFFHHSQRPFTLILRNSTTYFQEIKSYGADVDQYGEENYKKEKTDRIYDLI